MLTINRCPSCGNDKIKKVRRTWRGNFKGRKFTVPNLEYYECPNCGERVYDRNAMREIEAHSPVFNHVRPKRRSA